MKTIIALALLVAVVSATGVGGGQRKKPKTNGNVNDAIEYPCRFDCLQLVTKNNKQPLFASCRNSIISYGGDFFGDRKGNGFEINYQCFTPSTYQTLLASRGKLAHVINTCQSNQNRCRRANGSTFNTDAGNNKQYSGLPNIASLAVITTSKYYQWYSLFSNLQVVNNFVRCPAALKRDRRGRNKCNCDLFAVPDLFEDLNNPKMVTSASDNYKKPSDVPSPVNPYSSYVNGFLGNYSGINPFPNVAGDGRQLAQQARAVNPRVLLPVNLGCIDDDVDITSDCDDDRDD